MRHKHLLLTILILFVSGLRAEAATNYTVKAGGGGSFATIAACSAVAVAGDTCTVFAGTYAGWTQSVSGSAGNLITFRTNGSTLTTCAMTSCSGPNGDSVTVTSAINVSGVQFVQLIGFKLQNTIGFGTTTNHITVTHNYITTTLARQNDGVGGTDSDNVFSYNVIDRTGITNNAEGFYFYGDRNRFEHNEIKFGSGDCHDLGGANLVIRNNYCHDYNGISGEHLDFIQEIGGGTSPAISFSLVEGNIIQNCTADGGNCHGFAIIRTGSGPVADTIIFRYNYAQNIDGDGVNIGGVGDTVPNNSMYNNTLASEHLASYNGSFDSTQGVTTNTTVLNNIAFNVEAGGHYPFMVTGPGIENGNLAFTVGYTGSWPSPYSSEATYAALNNRNPLFANYPIDDTLQAGSPAIGAGVSLTTATGSGSSSTSLTVANAHVFQPGWSGAQADSIRIGATTGSPNVQISSINYSTNVITLASPQTWSSGTPIYLYKNSSGTVVLNNNNPDVGAYQFGTQAGPPPSAPSNLQAIVN
jgi:hypothetical protein